MRGGSVGRGGADRPTDPPTRVFYYIYINILYTMTVGVRKACGEEANDARKCDERECDERELGERERHGNLCDCARSCDAHRAHSRALGSRTLKLPDET